jgi:hypothetical protein
MADMKLRHAAALAVIVWLMMPLPLRAAGGPIAVPGTADVETGWYLMKSPPIAEIAPAPILVNKHWEIVGTFATQKECEAHRNLIQKCVASDDPRLKGK